MLKKAREKAKEGLRSVNAERAKRLLQTRSRQGQHGHGQSRRPVHPSGSTYVSFKGVDDDFEAILNDESDFTNQFDLADELEASGSSSDGHVPPHIGPSTVASGDNQTDSRAHADDYDLFSDPIFPESEQDLLETQVSSVNSTDPLLGASEEWKKQGSAALQVGDNYPEEELATIKTDTIKIPNSEDTDLHGHGHSVSPSSDIAALNDNTNEALLPALAPDTQESIRPDSPLFSDDVIADYEEDGGKVEDHSSATILVIPPSDESLQKHGKEDDLFGETLDQQLIEDESTDQTVDSPDSLVPELPDIEYLESRLAVKRASGGQDLFSSEDSPLSSLPSSYEGDKFLASNELLNVTTDTTLPPMATTTMLPPTANATLPPTATTTTLPPKAVQISGSDESELLQGEVASTVEEEVCRNSLTNTSSSQQHQQTHTVEEELEILLTPKLRPRMTDAPSSVSATPSTVTVEDPLHATQQEESRTERARSHLDSGVFEQSADSTALKSTPERETEAGVPRDDLFIIDEDHFKDDDSTPTHTRRTRRPLTKGSSNIEVSQPRKILHNTMSAPNVMPPSSSNRSGSGSGTSAKTPSTPPKKNSTGKIPPPRPAVSPKLRHRMVQKQSAPESSRVSVQQEDDMAKAKIVQPLGQAPQSRAVHDHSPAHSDSPSTCLSSHVATVLPQTQHSNNGSIVNPPTSEKRIPADDLFLEDLDAPDNDQIAGNLSPVTDSPLPSGKPETEQAVHAPETGESEDEEEEDYYFFYHLFFAGCLYFYYSLNIFPYLSGFFAGFLGLYLTIGSIFIFYVQTVEKYQVGDGKEDKLLRPSREFTECMKVDFDDLQVYKVSYMYMYM